MKVDVKLNPAEQIVRDKGLDPGGDVQMFHTQNVLRRIQKYMPNLTGLMIKLTIAQTDIRKPEIVTETPGAKYLFHGKVMIDPKLGVAGFMTPDGWRSRKFCKKVLTNRSLNYSRHKNPKAGPRWDVAVSTNEGAAMAADTQRFVNRRSGGK